MKVLSTCLIAAMVLFLLSSPSPGAVYQKDIPMDTGSVLSGPLTDFPVLVKLTPGRVNYAQFQSDGSDLRFYQGATQLAHEIESFDTSGDSLVWVKVPNVTSGQSIRMEWGTTGGAPLDPTGVWSNGYIGVYHLNETAGTDIFDSTAGANNGVVVADPTVDAVGKINGGMTFADYEENPVLTHPGARIDTPRPFWYEPTRRWIAPTYDHFENEQGTRLRCVGFYSSENLKDWTFESRVEQDKWGDELCGCVDFFQLPVDGDPQNKKWVMILIDGSYIVGTFDGHRFHTLRGKPAHTSDRVRSLVIQGNYYATMTWHNVPNDRRVQITWMRTSRGYPDMPFNQQMTIPSELTLHATDEGPRLRMNPIEELASLRTKTHAWKDLALKAGENPLSELEGDLFDLEVEFEPPAGSETVFDMRGTRVAYDADARMLRCGNTRAKLEPIKGAIRLRILLDRASIEVYGNDGRVYMPFVVFPAEQNRSLKAACDKGEAKANYLRVHELKSGWE